jgi:hypothetical protein
MATDHRKLAEILNTRIGAVEGAVTPAALRTGAAARAAGGPAIAEPYDALASTVGQASYRVTDAQVAAVRTALGSDVAAFEILMAAAVGAGLHRWGNAMRVLSEVSDAAE